MTLKSLGIVVLEVWPVNGLSDDVRGLAFGPSSSRPQGQ